MPDQESTLEDVQTIVAVSSCKGGVGKSTVAACIAQNLAGRGLKVGLLDADLYGPSVPALFDLRNAAVSVDERRQLVPLEHDGLKIMSFGFLLGDSPAVMRGPMVTNYIQQILHRTAWGHLDYLLIDMPPGTGDVQLTVTQSARLNGAVIVTTPQTLSLIDVARGILMFEKVSVPILGVVENMSYFICPDCSAKHTIFGSHASKSLQERFGVEILATWPLSDKFIHSVSPELSKDPLVRETVDKVLAALDKIGREQRVIPKVEFDQDYVTLTWSDGTQTRVANRDLRLSCGCALCVDERTGKPLLKEKSIRADIAPREITPLGNYAVGITWNDRHSSGIYPYKNIKEIAQLVNG
ncbi:MAG: P-loop NTPase [Candidatus Omnitrophica bacterium]|nr:P-loop NTPase [Candidatus Omnitrophota bacterium]